MVNTFMAHHQAMSIMAFADVLNSRGDAQSFSRGTDCARHRTAFAGAHARATCWSRGRERKKFRRHRKCAN